MVEGEEGGRKAKEGDEEVSIQKEAPETSRQPSPPEVSIPLEEAAPSNLSAPELSNQVEASTNPTSVEGSSHVSNQVEENETADVNRENSDVKSVKSDDVSEKKS